MANEFKHKDPGAELTQAEYISSDGTGHVFDSQAQGDIMYADSATVLKNLAKDANDSRVLTNTGTNNNPAWAQVTLTTGVTGTLPVANGGSGATSLTDGGILLGSGTAAVTAMSVLADGEIVVGDGSTDPVALAAFSSSTGALKVANGGTGATTLNNLITLGTHTTGNYVATVANATNGGTTIANSGSESAAVTITINLNGVAAGTVAVANDSIAIIDADDNATKKESIADFVSAIAGANLTATNGVLAASVASAVSREGGSTSEATTSSTSEDDLLSVGSLTIAATQPFFVVGLVRKAARDGTSGAAARAELHLALNSTNANGTNVFSTTNQSEAQLVKWEYGARVTNYLGHGYQFATDAAPNAVGKYAINSVALPTDEVTTVKLRGRSLHADVTYGVDEIHVYSLVTS